MSGEITGNCVGKYQYDTTGVYRQAVGLPSKKRLMLTVTYVTPCRVRVFPRNSVFVLQENPVQLGIYYSRKKKSLYISTFVYDVYGGMHGLIGHCIKGNLFPGLTPPY